jgi:uncharacterized protein YndB with AHSA1/START domain
MDNINFSIEISASPAKVWEKLWSEETYPIWTAAFDEGSRAKSDWLPGSRVLFLSGDGNGMIAEIDVVKPNEYMSFRHLGTYRNGEEDLESDSVKEWAGAMENYRLEDTGETTIVHVDVDVQPSDRAMMEKAFPDALVRLKQISEEDSE